MQLDCSGCDRRCCRKIPIGLLDVEYHRLEAKYPQIADRQTDCGIEHYLHPPCCFYDEGIGCSIYDDRPEMCREFPIQLREQGNIIVLALTRWCPHVTDTYPITSTEDQIARVEHMLRFTFFVQPHTDAEIKIYQDLTKKVIDQVSLEHSQQSYARIVNMIPIPIIRLVINEGLALYGDNYWDHLTDLLTRYWSQLKVNG